MATTTGQNCDIGVSNDRPNPARWTPAFIKLWATSNRWTFAFVALLSAALAANLYIQFLDNWRQRWDGIVHDRNAHCAIAMKMALAIQQGNWLRLGSEIEKCRVWPPAYDTVSAVMMAIGGVDFRVAVLPSLAGWLMTIWFGFLITRRLFGNEEIGNIAGVLAVVFILASPAHRIYATDVMLESLGAGLTLLVMYLYLLARQQPEQTRHWLHLSLALTILFFEKYNYWLLVALALCAESWWLAKHEFLAYGRYFVRLPWRAVIAKQIGRPRTYLLIGLSVIGIAICARGVITIQVAGKAVSLSSTGNFITIVYAVLFVLVVHELRVHWSRWWPHLAASQRYILAFHILPMAASFLLPHRLGAFLWYVRPNHVGEAAPRDPLGAATFYLHSAIGDYHVGLWSFCLVVAAFIATFILRNRLRRGVLAVLILAALGAILVVVHPNQKSRFLHSWLPVLWIASGAGLALPLLLWPATRRPALRTAVALTLLAALLFGHCHYLLSAGHSPELGHRHQDVSQFDATETYLPALDGSKRTAFLSTMPCRGLVESTYLQQYGRLESTEFPIVDRLHSAAELQGNFSAWLQSTLADTVVMIDVPPDSYFYADVGCDYEIYCQIHDMLARQQAFELRDTWYIDRYGCSISLWRRTESARIARE